MNGNHKHHGEWTAECESCPDRADFETLCYKGGVEATVTDPHGLLTETRPIRDYHTEDCSVHLGTWSKCDCSVPVGHFEHCHIYEGSWCTCGALNR
jgi:hypothetical protein